MYQIFSIYFFLSSKYLVLLHERIRDVQFFCQLTTDVLKENSSTNYLQIKEIHFSI